MEVVGQGGGVITTVSNPVPQRSRRRTAELYGKAETGPAPTMYSVVFDTGPAAGKSATLTLDQLLKGVPECWSAQKRQRRRRDGGGEDEVVLDDRDDDEDMVDEFGGLFPTALQVGERVEVRQRKGRKEEVWVLGRVKSSSAVGYDVVLDDGRVESCAARSVRPADEDGLNLLPVPSKKKRPKPAASPKPPKRRLSAFAADFFAVGADVDALFGMDLSVIRPRVCVARALFVCCVRRGAFELVASRRRPMVPRHRRRPREGRRRQAQVLRDPLAVERRLQPHRADEGAAARTGDAGRVINSSTKFL